MDDALTMWLIIQNSIHYAMLSSMIAMQQTVIEIKSQTEETERKNELNRREYEHQMELYSTLKEKK